jgi:hypothetical protein
MAPIAIRKMAVAIVTAAQDTRGLRRYPAQRTAGTIVCTSPLTTS